MIMGDSDVLPEQRVGQALRSAREAAGLSLRVMARRLNYNSHSTLSEYENGCKMPSETVVEGYERILGLELGTLRTVLEAANIERHGDAWAMRRTHLPLQYEPIHGIPSTPSAAASPWPMQEVADGADPDQAGCSADAITAHSRRIALPNQRSIIGHIELRYSPSAHAAWGRFKGYPLLDHLATQGPSVDIIVEVIRESDGTCLPYRQQYSFDCQWGDLLMTDAGLFQARAKVLLEDESLAYGETDRLTLEPIGQLRQAGPVQLGVDLRPPG